jgi:hypothetical protein
MAEMDDTKRDQRSRHGPTGSTNAASELVGLMGQHLAVIRHRIESRPVVIDEIQRPRATMGPDDIVFCFLAALAASRVNLSPQTRLAAR